MQTLLSQIARTVRRANQLRGGLADGAILPGEHLRGFLLWNRHIVFRGALETAPGGFAEKKLSAWRGFERTRSFDEHSMMYLSHSGSTSKRRRHLNLLVRVTRLTFFNGLQIRTMLRMATAHSEKITSSSSRQHNRINHVFRHAPLQASRHLPSRALPQVF